QTWWASSHGGSPPRLVAWPVQGESVQRPTRGNAVLAVEADRARCKIARGVSPAPSALARLAPGGEPPGAARFQLAGRGRSRPAGGGCPFRFADVLAGPHNTRVVGHAHRHVGECLRHERQNGWVVVTEVVAPAERVVDAAAVGARHIALVVAGVPTEQVDLLLGLAAILPGEQAAGGNAC